VVQPIQAAKAVHARPIPHLIAAVPHAPARNTSVHRAHLPAVPPQRLQVRGEADPTTAAAIAATRRAVATTEATPLREARHQVVATIVAAQAQAADAARVAATAVEAAAQVQAATAVQAEVAQVAVEEDNSATDASRKQNKDYLCSSNAR